MKLTRTLLSAAIAAAAIAAAPASANTLTYQGVTFQTMAVDADTLQLSILNATSATGDWTGINYLKAFEIKDIGNVTGATLSGWSTSVDNGLAAFGCTTGGTNGACFTSSPAATLTNNMVFSIDFTGTGLDFSAPHLKVQFLTGLNDEMKTGDLLSQTIPMAPIPEPETYALMLAGLSAMGFMAKRRKQAK
jgi:hypothetical protein